MMAHDQLSLSFANWALPETCPIMRCQLFTARDVRLFIGSQYIAHMDRENPAVSLPMPNDSGSDTE